MINYMILDILCNIESLSYNCSMINQILNGQIIDTNKIEHTLDYCYDDENVWLPLTSLCSPYETEKSNILEQLTNIFACGEVDKNSVVLNFRTTASYKAFKEVYRNDNIKPVSHCGSN